jgi:hypothetical protein
LLFSNINNFQKPKLLQIFCNSLRFGVFMVVWGDLIHKKN